MIMKRGKEQGTWVRDSFSVKVVSEGVAAIGKETKALGEIMTTKKKKRKKYDVRKKNERGEKEGGSEKNLSSECFPI